MIEKLPENKDKVFKTETGEYLTIPELSIPKPISDKINELIDAVNVLQAQVAILEEQLHPTAKVDPYAEQRRWIGKLCRFWFADAEHPTFGILDFVDAGTHPEPFHIDCSESEQGWYPHCEPVKPDDDIIYKKEEQ